MSSQDVKMVTSEERATIQIADIGNYSGSCGYCHSDSGAFSFSFVCESMSPATYDAMIQYGWRRSGTYYYRPLNHATCCPAYTIRSHVKSFIPTKSQRKTTRRSLRQIGDAYNQTKEKTVKSAGVSTGTPISKKAKTTPCEVQPTLMDTSSLDSYATSFLIELVGATDLDLSAFSVTTEEASFTEEKFALYCRYQAAVHKSDVEDLTRKQFTSFLCHSPLRATPYADKASGRWYGSKHQMYRVDGRLVAVGVVDELPTGLSSVYAFYEPSPALRTPEAVNIAKEAYEDDDREDLFVETSSIVVGDWGLGKLTALWELAYSHVCQLEYYYMGFYIPSCPKMRYKSEYGVPEIRCPITRKWVPVEEADRWFSLAKYMPFGDEKLCRARVNIGAQWHESLRGPAVKAVIENILAANNKKSNIYLPSGIGGVTTVSKESDQLNTENLQSLVLPYEEGKSPYEHIQELVDHIVLVNSKKQPIPIRQARLSNHLLNVYAVFATHLGNDLLDLVLIKQI